MRLSDIVRRRVPPVPWEEGENIPWNDPAFSERMLAEHLSQEHNLAYLQLQQEAQRANRRFSVATNLLKARHDTARAAINNLRV